MARFALDQRGMEIRPVLPFGLPGPTGATGATGNGAVFTAVDSLHVSPRAVADWGPIINAAIVAGSQRFIFGPFDYPFVTQINPTNVGGLHFQGAGGFNWTEAPAFPAGFTRLIWNGTGNTVAVSFSVGSPGPTAPTGFTMDDMMLLYSSGSFTGTLVTQKNAGFAVIRNCTFGSTTGTGTGQFAFDLGDENTIHFMNCMFNAFSFAVRGVTASMAYSNVAMFTDCTFNCPAGLNPGLDWLFDHCDFEWPDLSPTAAWFTTDWLYSGASNPQLTLRDCPFWDGPSANTQSIVRDTFANSWNLTIRGCVEHGSPPAGGVSLDLRCNGYIIVRDSSFAYPMNLGNAAIAGQKKNLIVLDGVIPADGGVGVQSYQGLNTGHSQVHVLASGQNRGNFQGSVHDGAVTLQEPIVTRWPGPAGTNNPAVTLHTGISNITPAIWGNDYTGLVQIQNTAGVASATGLLVDIAFKVPRVVQGPSSDYDVMLIHLTPVQGFGNNFIANSTGPQSVLCGAYPHYVSGTYTGWSIGVTTAIPAGATIMYAYSVTLMSAIQISS